MNALTLLLLRAMKILTGKVKNIKITKISQNTLFGKINSKSIDRDFAA